MDILTKSAFGAAEVALEEWPLAHGQAKALVVNVGVHGYELIILNDSYNDDVKKIQLPGKRWIDDLTRKLVIDLGENGAWLLAIISIWGYFFKFESKLFFI